ncbi:MAG: ABC transporter permease [Erysipelotrichaceae bacterium]
MKRYVRLYGLFMQQYLKALMEYRGDFLFGLVGFLLIQSVGVIFLQLVFQSIPTLANWSFYEILFIYGFAQIPRGIDHLFTDYLWIFSWKTIVKGEFDRYLLRPLNPLFQIIAERFQPDGFGEIIVGVLLCTLSLQRLQIDLSALDWMWMGVSILFATGIYTAIKLSVASLAFWVKFAQSYLYMTYQLSNFVKYPITIYPDAMKFILTFLIPFAFTGYFPAAYFLGKGSFFYGVVLTGILAVVFLFLAYQVWLKGMKAYESAGS